MLLGVREPTGGVAGVAGSDGNSAFNFGGPTALFSGAAAPLTFPPAVRGGSSFCTPSPHFFSGFFFLLAILGGVKVSLTVFCFFFFKILFLQRGGRREKERERNIDVRGIHNQLPLTGPQPGTWPATQAHGLTGNRTGKRLGSQAGTQSTEPHQPGLFPVALICILLMSLNIFSCAYWVFVYLVWRNVYSSPLPIF